MVGLVGAQLPQPVHAFKLHAGIVVLHLCLQELCGFPPPSAGAPRVVHHKLLPLVVRADFPELDVIADARQLARGGPQPLRRLPVVALSLPSTAALGGHRGVPRATELVAAADPACIAAVAAFRGGLLLPHRRRPRGDRQVSGSEVGAHDPVPAREAAPRPETLVVEWELPQQLELPAPVGGGPPRRAPADLLKHLHPVIASALPVVWVLSKIAAGCA
mmetsp:Transcript_33110/g.78521  ORF Transcript_33110/g.78521 Transcript_33110/m.78521 type:complete len:218 (+) Transcript_33110:5543-6196(+)